MGGRGASSGTSKAGNAAGGIGGLDSRRLSAEISSVEKRIDEVEATMERYARDATGYLQGVPGTSKQGLAKYQKARSEYVRLKEKRSKLLDEKVKRAPKSSVKKTFVNGFGEATTRDITSTTYERAQRRLDKDILRNMGY